jgi:Tol biopolymer transport system component
MARGLHYHAVALAFALLSLGLLCPGAARAATDPARRWFTLETEHFAIHGYDDGLAFAQRVAGYAEEAYTTLNPLLGWTPKERVHIRVVDDVDVSNGFASVRPYDGITLLAFPPQMGSDLAYADDWLRLLVFHEYTHIVHLDNATGVPEVLNTIFGKMLKPNEALPRWFTEGVATWAETYTTGGGRVGSSRYEMVLRMAVLADRLPSVDAITGPPLQLPRAMSWYLYGSNLIDHVIRHAGVDAFRDYLRAYGRRLIPYAMNTLARHHTGKDLVTWWDEMTQEIQARARGVAERIRGQSLKEGEARTHSGETKAHPHFTPDGLGLLYIRADGRSDSRLVMAPLERLDQPSTVAVCDGGCGRYDVSRDGRSVYMTTTRPYRRVNTYRDVIEIPLRVENRRGSGRRLTRGARFGDPSLSLDGRSLYGVSTTWGQTWVQVIDAITGDPKARWTPPEHARVDAPVPHPDGRRFFASMHHGANRDLIEVTLSDGRWRRLTYGASMESDPTLSPDGQWLLYASDVTGVANLYARDVSGRPNSEGRVFQLTNVMGGASHPCLSPDGTRLAYVGWTVDGDELFTMPFAPESGTPIAVGDDAPPRATVAPPIVRVSEPQPYRPLSTLLPRSWSPTVAYDTTGLAVMGIRLQGIDITRRLAGSLGVQWDIGREDVSGLATLGFGFGFTDFDVTLGRYSRDVVAHYDDQAQPYRQEVFHGRLGMSVALPDPIAPMRLSASFSTEVHRGLAHAEITHRPDETTPVVPTEGVTTSLRLAWSFDTSRGDVWSISKNRGAEGALSLRVSLPELGAEQTSFGLTYRLRGYLRMPWHAEHAMSLGVQGGLSGGEGPEVEMFDVGGVPRRDLVSDLIRQSHAGSVWLRGFTEEAFSSTAYHLATVEYRLPLFRWRRGLGTLPVFARDLTAAVFSDLAWLAPADDVDLSLADLHVGLGAELRMTTDLLFGFGARIRLGYAYGFGSEGVHHVYVLLAPDP